MDHITWAALLLLALVIDSSSSDTPLHVAAKNDKIEDIRRLLRSNADIDDNGGDTPLYLASYAGHIRAVNILLKHGASVDIPTNNYKRTPLYAAAAEGHLGVANILLKYGANINWPTSLGHTPLMSVVEKDNFDMVQLLLNNAAHVDMIQVINRFTALHWAEFYNQTNTVKLLLRHGADINHQDLNGFTVLMRAAEKGQLEIAQILVQNGADVNLISKTGTTALKAKKK